MKTVNKKARVPPSGENTRAQTLICSEIHLELADAENFFI